jgi:adenosylmethionine-8-amino-7-oxononanoate aminotransferase
MNHATATGTPIGGTADCFYSRAGTAILPMIERAEGIRFYDADGKDYIDGSCGPMVSCLGHGHARVIDAMAAQARKLDYAFTLVARNRPNAALAERLARLAGPGFERVAFGSGGSEAMERALQFARQYAVATGQEKRTRILSLEPSYHGATIATLGISGDQSQSAFYRGFAAIAETVPAPMPYRRAPGQSAEEQDTACAAALEAKIQTLGAETVLALVVEPIGGITRGGNVPTAAYMRAIRATCTRHGVILIFDEIISGIGRTGPMFAMEHWPDARPDILVLAKGLGGGLAAIAAMLAPAAMVDRLAGLTGFEFVYSYNAHPVACAGALAVLDEIEERGLLANAQARGHELEAGLRALAQKFPMIGDVRGCGLYFGVEIVRDRATKESLPQSLRPMEKMRNQALSEGLMVYARATSGGKYGNWFMLAPPLNVTSAEVAEILDRLERALRGFEQELLGLLAA